MLRGVNNLNLDAKGRLAIPARYRDQLTADCDGQLIVTVSNADRCLWIYPLAEWELIEQKLVALPSMDAGSQRLKRILIGHATDIELDKSGRVLLPAELREFAGLTKPVTLLGQGNKFELWDEAEWNRRRESWLDSDDGASAMAVELEQISL